MKHTLLINKFKISNILYFIIKIGISKKRIICAINSIRFSDICETPNEPYLSTCNRERPLMTRFKDWLKWQCHYSLDKNGFKPGVMGFSVGEYYPMSIFPPVSHSPTHLYHRCNFLWLLFSSPHSYSSCLHYSFNKPSWKKRQRRQKLSFLLSIRIIFLLCREPSVFPSGTSPRVKEKERVSWFSSTSCEQSHYKTSEFLRLRAMPQRVFTGDSCSRSARTVYKVPSNSPERKPTAVSIISTESQELTTDIHDSARCPCNFHDEIQIE